MTIVCSCKSRATWIGQRNSYVFYCRLMLRHTSARLRAPCLCVCISESWCIFIVATFSALKRVCAPGVSDMVHLCASAYRTWGSWEQAGCVTASGSSYISVPSRPTSLGGVSLSVCEGATFNPCVCVCVCARLVEKLIGQFKKRRLFQSLTAFSGVLQRYSKFQVFHISISIFKSSQWPLIHSSLKHLFFSFNFSFLPPHLFSHTVFFMLANFLN